MNYPLLFELLRQLQKFEDSIGTDKSTLQEFRLWLNQQSYLVNIPDSNDHSDVLGSNTSEVEISKLLIYTSRYAKFLIKKGLESYPMLVNEDITYIYTLMGFESMTKIQLIEKNVHEKPTGMEIIRRLLKNELIDEKNDLNDRRSKRVFLTEKGRRLFFDTLSNMRIVAKIVSGTLTENEKQTLLVLLKKLDEFHNPIFLEEKGKPIDELATKVSMS